MDRRSITSAENGRKGGRPKGFATLESERQRNYLAEVLVIEFAPIVKKAVEQARKGDKAARDWLADRAFGKPLQSTDITSGGESLIVQVAKEIIDKANVPS